MIHGLFSFFLFIGSEWILWILAACSLLCVAVIFDRARVLSAQANVGQRLWGEILAPWIHRGVPETWRTEATEILKRYPCVEARLLNSLTQRTDINAEEIEKVSHSILAIERLQLERNLAILGTLGNSAPFIGLFGTVLGIIKAFSELGSAANGGLNAISGGLAEALVTTATGLLVALPSAIAFNYFQRKMKTIFSRASSLSLSIAANSQKGKKS